MDCQAGESVMWKFNFFFIGNSKVDVCCQKMKRQFFTQEKKSRLSIVWAVWLTLSSLWLINVSIIDNFLIVLQTTCHSRWRRRSPIFLAFTIWVYRCVDFEMKNIENFQLLITRLFADKIVYKEKIALHAIQRDPMIGVWVMEYPRLFIDIFFSIYIDTRADWIPSISSSRLIEKSYTKCLLNQSVNKSLRWLPLTSEFSLHVAFRNLSCRCRVRVWEVPSGTWYFGTFLILSTVSKKHQKAVWHNFWSLSRRHSDITNNWWWQMSAEYKYFLVKWNIKLDTKYAQQWAAMPEWWRIAFEMGNIFRVYLLCVVCVGRWMMWRRISLHMNRNFTPLPEQKPFHCAIVLPYHFNS